MTINGNSKFTLKDVGGKMDYVCFMQSIIV